MRKRFLKRNEQSMEEMGIMSDAAWWQMDEPWSQTEERTKEKRMMDRGAKWRKDSLVLQLIVELKHLISFPPAARLKIWARCKHADYILPHLIKSCN